jgi:hypothetical protein
MDIALLEQIIAEQDKEDLENQEDQLENPEAQDQEEAVDDIQLTTDLPQQDKVETPVSIEQKIDLLVVTTFNNEDIEATVAAIDKTLKKLKVSGVVYAVQNITDVQPEIPPSDIDIQNQQAANPEEMQPEENPVQDLDIDNV